MEMRKMKLALSAGALALSLALAGCGGGGSPQAAGPTPAETQHMDVSSIITAAETAVGDIDAMSTDDDVAAAQAAIDAARDALNEADLLKPNQAVALNARISAIEMTLASTESAIDDHRQMVASDQQHMTVEGAIDMAKTAVDALDAMSTDDDVAAAQAAIDAARKALDEADLLSGNQVFALGESLSDIEMTLASTESDIDKHRKMVADNEQLMKDQRMTADEAIGMANTAVAGLSGTSTDEEVTAAKGAIQDAKDAVMAATSLSDSDRAGLNDRISNIETMLASTETAIATHRQMVADDNQRMGVSTAIDAAMAAVGDLDAMSTDEDVNDAKALIEAAETALTDATSILTAEAALALNDRISTIKMTLASTETAITAHRKMVADDAETQRVKDVATARSNAMQSYMDANDDATDAEAAADMAEAASPGSPGAEAARAAATAARTAANAAKDAHEAIMDDMTKAEADAEAQKAADAAGDANREYMTAKMENDDIQTDVATNKEQQRVRDVAAATMAADKAAMAARDAATMARGNATEARKAANTANAAYMRAMAARTNSMDAQTKYMDAKAAAEAAEMAATAAETAADAAEAAHKGIVPEGSGEDAQTAQMTAETKQGEAETEQGTASTQYMTAMTASGDAVMAAREHVLSLFMAANGAHVMDDDMTDANETAVHVASVGTAMAEAANAAHGNQADGTTATAMWPGDTVENPATDRDQFMAGTLMISVDPGNSGTAIPFNLKAVAADPDASPAVETVIQTARMIAPLGVFRGYDLWEDDGDATTDTDRARAIVFTNKEKGKDSVLARDGGAATSVNGQAVNATELSNVRSTGNTITGVTWKPSGKAPLTGTLTCGETCNIELGDDGAVTEISGYTFAGSRETVKVVTAEDAMDEKDYLIFGLWLDEGDDGTDFGAFANGGGSNNYKYTDTVNQAVTGEATYSGHAAGAHHKTGDGVNWFHGDASLTADFGKATDEAGTISGEISNIQVNGGEVMQAPIYLGEADLTGNGSGTFSGVSYMGAQLSDDTNEYNGTWSGSFFGPTANDGETDADESVTAPLATAGTFGVTKSEGTGDDMVVESFVGAFGAHKTE